MYLIDRPSAEVDDLALRQAPRAKNIPAPTQPGGTLLALDRTDGRILWRRSDDIYGTLLALSPEHDVLLMSYQSTRFKLPSELGGRMRAFRASDGEPLWETDAVYGSRPVLNGRIIYAQPGSWDLLTGEALPFRFSRSYGCGTVAGSRHLLVFRSATLGYVDLTSDRGTENYGGIRPGCWINAIPAGGMVLMPDATDRCRCSYLIKASIGLRPYGLRGPVLSPRQAYSPAPISVTVSHPRPGADLRYTLDGAAPGSGSPRYRAPLRITTSRTLNVRAFLPGMPPSPITKGVFVIDPAIVPIDGPGWRVVDPEGANPPVSDWQVKDGIVTERSNLYKGDAANPDPAMERPGSLRIYAPGEGFGDGELTIDLGSSDNDGLGVVFRYQAPDRYYLWAMDKQRGFHVLACKNGESYRVLAASGPGYEQDRWYGLKIVLRGASIGVYLDRKKDLEAVDETFASGTFGLYSWGCAGAKFRYVRRGP